MSKFSYRSHTLGDVIAGLRSGLAPKFGEREATQMIYFALEQLKGWSGVQIAIRRDEELSDFIIGELEEAFGRVLADEPIQYVFGKAHFYGMDLKVTPATLIPRPETAQLVDIIAERYGDRSDLRVLDIGTGSGCIAIALARNLPFARVTATDISTDALEVAKANAAALRAKVEFKHIDMLDTAAMDKLGQQDIIVSNPPYILLKEAEAMEPNVVDHEPATALFVPDADPLRFYTPTIALAARNLAPQGRIYLEINPLCAGQISAALTKAGLADAEIIKDYQGRDRFAIATKA